MHTFSFRLPGPNGGLHTTTLTDEQLTFIGNNIPVNPRDFNALMRHYAPPPEFGTIEQWIANFDAWATSVLSGEKDEELWSRRQIGPVCIENIKRALRSSRGLPEPASPAPSTASKAETVKPNGVSYSIHVDNVHNAVALSWIASVLNERGVYDTALESLAMIVDYIMEQYHVEQSAPEADEQAIHSMERLIDKIRKANQ